MIPTNQECQPYSGALSEICFGSQLTLFLSVISSFISKNYDKSQFCYRPSVSTHVAYDFIVVGGGTAGSVIASRLSEVKSWTVLLIEAGPEEPLGALVPSFVGSFLGSDIDWKYSTVNESNACLNKGGSCYWPRGKNLGGCSVHNGMMYTRGHPRDYDDWQIPGWSYKDVLPYFKYSENNREILNSSYHGTGGPLTVEHFPWQPPFTQAILDGAKEAGYPLNDDLNGENITGFTVAQTTSKNGVRVSSASAFLRPVRNRPNLHVLLNATATQLITVGREVVGVKYYQNGKYHINLAKREVVVSAGTIGSPHLLLLSGIGPADHLIDKKIDVVSNQPGVGRNVMNHVSFSLQYSINDTDVPLNKEDITEYIERKNGPLSSTGLAQVTGVLASNNTTPDHPDVQIFFSGYGTACSDNTNVTQRTVSIRPVYMHTKSRGTIRLSSNDPFEHPIITQNYLTEENDINGLIEGIKIGLALGETKAFQKYNATLAHKPIDACAEFEFKTDKYWRCAISQNTLPENHQCGSCKMGHLWDPHAVVDHTLKVFGLKGLRVADLSIIPKIVSGNPASVAIMIGERAAAFIKQEHKW